MRSGAVLWLLAAGAATAAPWPPRAPARALPVFEAIWAEVEAGETCEERAGTLDRAVRARLSELVEVSRPSSKGTAAEGIADFTQRVARLDASCADDADWRAARRFAHSLGLPPFHGMAEAELGTNQRACHRFHAHLTALPCYPVAIEPSQMCPLALDHTPLDMGPYYACLQTEMYCGEDGILQASGTGRCTDALVPPL